MEDWKRHVRLELMGRDSRQKDPHAGVYSSLSRLQEKCEIRKQILDDHRAQTKSSEGRGAVEVGSRLLQLQLRESEHLSEKLSQTVSDLTGVLYLKDAEVQYWQSQVSRYRQEALTLAGASKTLKAALSECEFTTEQRCRELADSHAERSRLREALAAAGREKEELLRRRMEEKGEEAARVNRYNDAQERWQRLAGRLNKRLRPRKPGPAGTGGVSGRTEESLTSSFQRNNNTDVVRGRASSCAPATERT